MKWTLERRAVLRALACGAGREIVGAQLLEGVPAHLELTESTGYAILRTFVENGWVAWREGADNHRAGSRYARRFYQITDEGLEQAVRIGVIPADGLPARPAATLTATGGSSGASTAGLVATAPTITAAPVPPTATPAGPPAPARTAPPRPPLPVFLAPTPAPSGQA